MGPLLHCQIEIHKKYNIQRDNRYTYVYYIVHVSGIQCACLPTKITLNLGNHSQDHKFIDQCIVLSTLCSHGQLVVNEWMTSLPPPPPPPFPPSGYRGHREDVWNDVIIKSLDSVNVRNPHTNSNSDAFYTTQ